MHCARAPQRGLPRLQVESDAEEQERARSAPRADARIHPAGEPLSPGGEGERLSSSGGTFNVWRGEVRGSAEVWVNSCSSPTSNGFLLVRLPSR